MNERAFGLTAIEFRKLAYEYPTLNKIDNRFNKETKMAGKEWLYDFMKENKISLRTPEATSLGRLMSFNRTAVSGFYDILRNLKLKYNFTPDRIYNADESGLSTVPSQLPKVLSPTGNRRVAKVSPAERGRNTTLVCAMNAQGSYIPPFLIFGRVRKKPELLYGCPPNTVGIAQSTGWMTTECFVQYLEHFAKYSHSSIENPILLIVDNHSSHKSLEAINYCRINGIVMLGLQPHSTHKLQPLDVSFFGPLKTYYGQACDNFMTNNPGKTITDRQLGPIFADAYLKAATIGIAIKGFVTTGIEPFNPGVFSDVDFAPSAVSERERASETLTENENNDSDGSEDEPLATLQRKQTVNSPVNTALNVEESVKDPTPTQINPESHNLSVTSLYDIKPLPKYNRLSTTSKRQKASIITSTPEKLILEEKEKEKNNKHKKSIDTVKKSISTPSKPFNLTAPVMNNSEPSTSGQKFFCPGCHEKFEDPPPLVAC